jgi:hypothetical protein
MGAKGSAKRGQRRQPAVSGTPLGDRLRILVVEDEEAIVDFVEMGLRYEGFDVDVAKERPRCLNGLRPAASRSSRP